MAVTGAVLWSLDGRWLRPVRLLPSTRAIESAQLGTRCAGMCRSGGLALAVSPLQRIRDSTIAGDALGSR